MGIYEYNIASDEDGNDYLVETPMDSPGTSEEEIEADEPPAGSKRTRYGRRTVEATEYVSRWPGSTSNDVVRRVGANRASGQYAVNAALGHGLIENRGTSRRFELYLTPKGHALMDENWDAFSDDAATWRPGDEAS